RRERAAKWARRHPRLMSAYGVGAIAAAFLLAVGSLAAWRGHQLAMEREITNHTAFRDELLRSRYLLGTPNPTPDYARAGEEVCRAALARYGRFDEDNNWVADRRRLSADVKESVSELLMGLSRSVRQRGENETDPARRASQYEAARALNRQAQEFQPPAG